MIMISEKFKFYQKSAETRVLKILITIPFTLATMRQFIIKPWRSYLGPWCQKNFKCIQKLGEIAIIFLKSIPLTLKTIQ